MVGVSLVSPTFAYKLSTRATEEERKLSGITANYWKDMERAAAQLAVTGFTEPVHEEITNRSYGCDADANVCNGDRATFAPASVLAGVRWNDDPPFRMTGGTAKGFNCKTTETIRFETQPVCWATLFRDANSSAAKGKEFGPGDAMLYRTHFGDLQFLHSMASRNGERASATKDKMLNWFEFTWRAARGEYTLDTRLKDIQNPSIQAAFGRGEWRMLDLYTLGSAAGLRRQLKDVAFGSMLHTVQDSFAGGHVEREESSGTRKCSTGSVSVDAPGDILAFHAYNHQDHKLHAAADSRVSLIRQVQQPGDAVEFGKALVEARDQNLDWPAVRPLFDCLLTLRRPDAEAGPGESFASR